MELTTPNYRKLKNILSLIPGAPASSQLAEAIARGLGYENHNDLRLVLDAIDTAFGQVTLMEPDIEPMLEALKGFGVGKFEAMDLVATFFAISGGDFYWDDLDSFPEIHGAGIIRHDVTTPEWRDAAKTGWEAFASAMRIDGIEVAMPTGWRSATEFHDLDGCIRIRRGDLIAGREGDDILAEDLVSDRHGYVLEGYIENIIIHARAALPGPEANPEIVRNLGTDAACLVDGFAIDEDGIRFLCRAHHSHTGAEVWIARFHGGPVKRVWLDAA